MPRCLHVTIHENATAKPRRLRAGRPGRLGSDPASEYLMPPIDDPASEYLMPPIDDPASEYLMPPIDDPASEYLMPPIDDPSGTGYGGSGGSGGRGNATATVSSCCCDCHCGCGATAAACATGTATPHPFIAPRDFSGFVIVRTAPEIDPDIMSLSLWDLAGPSEAPRLPGLKAVLELPFKDKKGHLTSRPLVELLEGQGQGGGELLKRGDCLERIRALERATALTAFPPLQSLTTYWRLDLREHSGLAEEVVVQLNLLAEVDLAYRELAANDPEAGGQTFAEDQGYLSDAPAGISASWAWKSLADLTAPEPPASLLTICDLEQGWNPGHNYLSGENVLAGFIYGKNRNQEGTPGHHGTAVLGELAAAGRFRGTAPGLGRFVLASHYKSKAEEAYGKPHPFAGTNSNVAAAITQALEKQAGLLKEGDILLLEVQRGLLPTEVDEADFNAIRLASGLGVLVIEAAGNGGFDLDAFRDPATGRRSLRRGGLRFRDSGAVLVGASRASVPHDRALLSNYGSRLDCYGWGEAVTTCGYGDLAGTTTKDFYTNSFSGTSSASPIIAGAAALLQALHTKQTGFGLKPEAMRDLLSDPETGTPQGPNVSGFIGVMPDLKAVLRQGLQLVQDVYMRRHVGDAGTAPGLTEEISSSPDILVWQGTEVPATRFGEDPRTNHPAPGSPIDPANPNAVYTSNNLYVRLRNRGTGQGKARVQLFASPAATLITPERWMPIGSVDVQGIPQGDTLTVSDPIPVDDLPTAKWIQNPAEWLDNIVPAYSFLAVQLPWKESSSAIPDFERTNALPPGPPYFDWATYRSFLRGPGVTWRNVHPIRTKAGTTDMTLAFLFAGTPDRTRYFEFEVIQRLPAGVDVTLQVPAALAAKLRQGQPWLRNGSPDLKLPRRPRTAFRRVALAPGVYAHAAFHLHAPLLRGHSLAIRQLWHGEEVGRITWCFIDE